MHHADTSLQIEEGFIAGGGVILNLGYADAIILLVIDEKYLRILLKFR